MARLTWKDNFEYIAEGDQAFETLKVAFTIEPIQTHSNFQKPFFLQTDASDFALKVLFSQFENNRHLHPLGLYYRKFSNVETNYKIQDNELLAIVDSFQE